MKVSPESERPAHLLNVLETPLHVQFLAYNDMKMMSA
jgi:hypothetical protein